MSQKLMKGKLLRFTLGEKDLENLEYEKREDIVEKWIKWQVKDAKLKSELTFYQLFTIGGFLGGLFISPLLLLLLLYFFPKLLGLQFDYGDSSSDRQRWLKKYMTRIDGFDIQEKR